MTRKRIFSGLAAAVLVAIVGYPVLYFIRIQIPPTVTADIDDQDRMFWRFAHDEGVFHVLNVGVWKEASADYAWYLDVRYAPLQEVTYGVVPSIHNASRQSVEQRHPPDDAPPPRIEVGDTFYLSVDYQCDNPVPSVKKLSFRFRLDQHQVVALPLPPSMTYPKNHPKPKPFLRSGVQ